MEDPSRGGGVEAMEILHHFGIKGSKKGILKKNCLDEEYLNATGSSKCLIY